MTAHNAAWVELGRAVLAAQPFSVMLGTELLRLERGEAVVTAEFKINYLRPAKGNELVARAVTLHAGENRAVCRCDVFVQDGHGVSRLCTTAQGTISRRVGPRPHAPAHHA